MFDLVIDKAMVSLKMRTDVPLELKLAMLLSRSVPGVYIAGGAARYMASGNDVPYGDIDLFCVDSDIHRVAYYHLSKLFGEPDDRVNSVMFGGVYNLVKIKDGSVGKTLTELVMGFDFTVSCAYYDPEQDVVWVHPDFYEHEFKKKLVINNLQCAFSTMSRIAKYSRKGYHVGFSEILKVLMNFHENFSDYQESIGKIESVGEMSAEEVAELYGSFFID